MDENENVQVITPEVMTSSRPSESSCVRLKEQKIREYYQGEPLAERMVSEDMSVETLMQKLVVELMKESDSMVGNRAIADENGDIERSTVIGAKRSEILKETMKTVMAKREFEASNSIDVDSPSMRIVFSYFIDKCRESFNKSGMSSEISDVFFRNLTDLCSDWKKDLKRKIAELKT